MDTNVVHSYDFSFVGSGPLEYLEHVMISTNMSCPAREGALCEECDFFSPNMHAQSSFGKVISLLISSRCFAELLQYRRECGGKFKLRADGCQGDSGHVRIWRKTAGYYAFAGGWGRDWWVHFLGSLYSAVLRLLLGG